MSKMKKDRIVARFKDGSLLKGESNDFSRERSFFSLKLIHGEFMRTETKVSKTVNVALDDLKALFFVKDFNGNKKREDNYINSILWGYKKVKSLFHDGEEIAGYALHYDLGRWGFFMEPADQQSNNERIFVINSATQKVTFL